MYKASLIAKWFLLNNNAEIKLNEIDEMEVYEGITHLKLQKLLYYAQGISLALTGEQLFSEPICAWEHGPVVESIYQEYKKFGKDNILVSLSPEDEDIINKIDDKTNEILRLTYDNFAIYTAWQLRNLTHKKNSPWWITVNKKGFNKEISLSLIKDYFLENVVDND